MSIGLPSIVENKVTDPREWLTCLIKFTKGEAKEIAKNCIELLWVQDCQRTAHWKIWRSASYRIEIKHWPQIKASDADSYRRFQNFLVKRENIDHFQSWKVLNTPDIICMLLSKLPGSVRDKWSRKVLAIRRRGNREPEMADFIQFVNDET